MLVKIEWLKEQMQETLKHLPEEQRTVVIDVLLWADMTGKHTQGVMKLTGTEPLQNITPRGDISIDTNKCATLVHGNGHPSPFTTIKGLEAAIQAAHTHGVGIAGVSGIFSSTSAQSYYTYHAAQGEPLFIDYTTSACTWYALILAKLKGERYCLANAIH